MSAFSDKLQSATNEDKQVNPIYVQAIAKELPKVILGGNLKEVTELIRIIYFTVR